MAISTNDSIEKFGTEENLETTSAAVADGAFSAGVSDLNAWTNADDAYQATAIITFQYASGSLDTYPVIYLHAAKQDVDGTASGDEAAPSAANPARLCAFRVKSDLAAATDQTISMPIVLDNARGNQVYHFYIENKIGVTISAGWKVVVTPKTKGPHA